MGSAIVTGGIISALSGASKATNLVGNAARALQKLPAYSKMSPDKIAKLIRTGEIALSEASAASGTAVSELAAASNYLKGVHGASALVNTLMSPTAEAGFEAVNAYNDRVEQGRSYLNSPEVQQKI